jgi:putative membrane protein
MKFSAYLVSALLVGSSAVYAQQTNPPPAGQQLQPGQVPNNGSSGGEGNGTGNADTSKGVMKPGANSFTEAQARERIEKAGYTNVSGLVKTQDGFWRGKAMKGGQTVQVSVDYQGNVSAM